MHHQSVHHRSGDVGKRSRDQRRCVRRNHHRVGRRREPVDLFRTRRISFDANTYQFSETGTADKTLSYELFGLNSDQTGEVQICFGAPYEFVNSDGGEAASGTLPDGSPGFVDLLPSCDADFEGIGPCVASIEPYSDDTSGLLVTVDVPGMLVTGAPADPSMHG